MSTRSNIAIQLPDGKVKVIYVHSDGYPDGVGKCLIENYNDYEKAIKLFNHGDASYLGSTIDECSFYGRDWKRNIDHARIYNTEWLYMNAMRGEEWHIEYIYLFKDGAWFVSSGEYVNAEDTSIPTKVYGDSQNIGYYSEFVPVKKHRHYTGKTNEHTEVKMVGQIMQMLKSAGFDDDNVEIQGGKVKKAN